MHYGAKGSKLISYIVHSLAYYLAWLGCMYLAANGYAWLSAFLVIVCVAIQFTWEFFQPNNWRACWHFLVVLVGSGILVDSTLIAKGWLVFVANPWAPYFTAPWMIGIWLSFGSTVYFLLRHWLRKPWLLAVLALPGFSFAYWVGVQIGAAHLPFGSYTCVIIGLIWMFLLPLCAITFNRWQGAGL